jgi:hypothetical protein
VRQYSYELAGTAIATPFVNAVPAVQGEFVLTNAVMVNDVYPDGSTKLGVSIPPVEVNTATGPGHCRVMVPLVPEKTLAGEAVSATPAHVVDNAGVVTVTDGTVWLKSTVNP